MASTCFLSLWTTAADELPALRGSLWRGAQGKHFSCLDQFRSLAFAQLTWRESLRGIEACLNAQASKLYRLGFRSTRIARNTLSNANAVRDWRIYADLAQHLIGLARHLYAGDTPPGLEGLDTVYALDSSTIDLCLSVFPWAPFRSTKAAIELHTLLDLRGNIPSFIFISDGKMGDVRILDLLQPEPGGVLCDGPRLCRFRTAGALRRCGQLLRHARKIQPAGPPPQFTPSGPVHRADL